MIQHVVEIALYISLRCFPHVKFWQTVFLKWRRHNMMQDDTYNMMFSGKTHDSFDNQMFVTGQINDDHATCQSDL